MSAHYFWPWFSYGEPEIPGGDPGTAKAIANSKAGMVSLAIAASASETNTLANPVKAGLMLTIVARTVGSGGTRAVTVASAFDSAGNTVLTFAAAGQAAVLWSVPSGSSFVWKLIKATANISSGGTTAYGFINIPLASWRIIASADVGVKGATDGGTVSKDTDPILERTNVGTDPSLRLSWASASVLPIIAQFSYPPDLDDGAPIVLNFFAGMKAASVDVPVLTCTYFEGVGDTNAGGSTAALSTTAGLRTVSIAASDVGPYPASAAISLVPGAHNTASNDVYVYGSWITYKKLTS